MDIDIAELCYLVVAGTGLSAVSAAALLSLRQRLRLWLGLGLGLGIADGLRQHLA